MSVNGRAGKRLPVGAAAAANELKAKGAKILLGPVVGPRTTYVFIADNSGIPFELIQFKGE
jgi:hypothetical protein